MVRVNQELRKRCLRLGQRLGMTMGATTAFGEANAPGFASGLKLIGGDVWISVSL